MKKWDNFREVCRLKIEVEANFKPSSGGRGPRANTSEAKWTFGVKIRPPLLRGEGGISPSSSSEVAAGMPLTLQRRLGGSFASAEAKPTVAISWH